MASEATDFADRLKRTREQLGFTQDDLAHLTGQPRTVVSNWESGARRPNSHQLDKLALIFRVPRSQLLGGPIDARPDFEQLMFRDAEGQLDPKGRFEIQRFLGFLDSYGDLLDALGEAPGLSTSPFALHEGFSSKEDMRRRAEDARAYFKLGLEPIANLRSLADAYGITVYYAPLGADLRGTVSGAFVPHHGVGFSILVNGETTPGRQLFTLAHEIGHALFHGDRLYINYFGRREAAERFANTFAGEFLAPTHHLRATVESFGVSKVTDPEVVVHLQRYYRVSYDMMLVRLSQANLVTDTDRDRLRHVRPVHLAVQLGYETDADEWAQDPAGWGLTRFPPRFLRLLRRAFAEDLITVSGAAAMTGLAGEDIEQFLADRSVEDAAENRDEFAYFTEST
jgi:Zn-dependent peptidase ImmA (M78 family)/transcriptional regulator with XRE-family HTH domain